jgi:hypothetical protein
MTNDDSANSQKPNLIGIQSLPSLQRFGVRLTPIQQDLFIFINGVEVNIPQPFGDFLPGVCWLGSEMLEKYLNRLPQLRFGFRIHT